MMCHLANAQSWSGLAGGNTGRLFLTFGGLVCADWISNCPLDRVLTYTNLICLLNLQFCVTKEHCNEFCHLWTCITYTLMWLVLLKFHFFCPYV